VPPHIAVIQHGWVDAKGTSRLSKSLEKYAYLLFSADLLIGLGANSNHFFQLLSG
jgi:hypothetical protein